MNTLLATYKDDEEFEAPPLTITAAADTPVTTTSTASDTPNEPLIDVKSEPDPSDDEAASDGSAEPKKFPKRSPDSEDEERLPKKQKHLSSLTANGESPSTLPPNAVINNNGSVNAAMTLQKHLSSLTANGESLSTLPPDAVINNNGSVNAAMTLPIIGANSNSNSKKSKKKNNNMWATKSKKGKKKSKINNNNSHANIEDKVLITPVTRFPDKSDDTPEMKICLSKVYKAEKVELSEDRMSAGSTKGYRMVRATRGVVEGAWYFEIKVVKLGETGHARLGWSTEKGDLQAPVGFDVNSFGYRDIDGSKIHKALREKYGEDGYKEGDVIGFYINLPDGEKYAPKAPHLVWYKGQSYVCAQGRDAKEDPAKVVPGSEISFFKNGMCQGVAFKDLYGGCYYPAASMYTLPGEPNCTVKFNFGPDFEFFPEDFNERPIPKPMIEVPYHGFDIRVENGESTDKTSSKE